MKIKASVFILTKNSEATIRRALESVAYFDDIVICDGGSKDETLSIASQFGARIFSQSSDCLDLGKVKDFACLRNNCMAYCENDWVLYIDSDETASPGLVEEISNVVSNRFRYDAYFVPARIVVDGKEISYSSNYPGYQIRFFKKLAGIFKKPVHERFVASALSEIGKFRSPWHYYVDSKKATADFISDIPRDMDLYRDRYSGKSFWGRIRGALIASRTIAAIIAKSSKNYLVHGFKEAYPPYLELLRIRYQWEIIKAILWPINY